VPTARKRSFGNGRGVDLRERRRSGLDCHRSGQLVRGRLKEVLEERTISTVTAR